MDFLLNIIIKLGPKTFLAIMYGIPALFVAYIFSDNYFVGKFQKQLFYKNESLYQKYTTLSDLRKQYVVLGVIAIVIGGLFLWRYSATGGVVKGAIGLVLVFGAVYAFIRAIILVVKMLKIRREIKIK